MFTAEADCGLQCCWRIGQNILVQMAGSCRSDLATVTAVAAFMPHATERLDTIDEAQAEDIFTREQLLRCFLQCLLVNSLLP
ncbi:hypothetical protein O6A27_06210 [Escherichia coli]|nr:hypothetical protein [Escherichia coli]